MKKITLIALASIMIARCYKEDTTFNSSTSPLNTSSNKGTTSHACGYITNNGTPCKPLVSGTSGYCWQHK